MPTDKQNVEFLWAIVKQLEVKHIDWSIVASTNNISNGHAARMRYHRLRQAMEGIATKHRTAKSIDDGREGSKGKDKSNTKTAKPRKAKNLDLKRKLADISDDEEEPLAHVKARRRTKEEPEDSEDEYVDSETEQRRAAQKRIKKKEAIETYQDGFSFSPRMVKAETTEAQTFLSSRKKSTPIKLEIAEDPIVVLRSRKAATIKDEVADEDDVSMIDRETTAADDVRVKKEEFEPLVEV
ncbi:hypothetical protein FKW77_007125 [Venturia effusa]|uniref:Myb-like DNA-binding domain-containing protein n=1 Tax=Venturia effusa TaxID=50376 RepID=A0A517L3L1_9PEZI|nr:hypothetical protein FKW77_007125 [Venturia effusa]